MNTNVMHASNNFFLWSRFVRVFCNDFASQWKRLGIASLALIGIYLLIYVLNIEEGAPDQPFLFLGLFPLALIGGGLLFTGSIFGDLHHPLQRFHFLTLPCSNFERFISRYLLTGPVFFVYVVLGYAIFDTAAALISSTLIHGRDASFSLYATPIWQASVLYFFLHSVMLLGTIYFRSHALLKTWLVSTLLTFLAIFVQVLSIRLVFWEYFTTLIPSDGIDLPVSLFAYLPEITLGFGFVLHIWVLYLGYATLCDHEVQE